MDYSHTESKHEPLKWRAIATLALASVLGIALVASTTPAGAQGGKPDASIPARLASLEALVAGLTAKANAQQTEIVALKEQVQQQQLAIDASGSGEAEQNEAITQLTSDLSATQSSLANLETTVDGFGTQFNAMSSSIQGALNAVSAMETQVAGFAGGFQTLGTRATALESKTRFFSTSDTELTISGANVFVVNGTGSTGSVNGLGNLVVGYNAPRAAGNQRNGSHNLIVGDEHNFTSFGGAVFGHQNTIASIYASVVGGSQNAASGDKSSVSGGTRNRATGFGSSVSGGDGNTAFGAWASAAGGQSNQARGDYSFAGAGFLNSANGHYAAITGGYSNVATGSMSSISGGQFGGQAANYGWRGGSFASP